MKSIKHARSPLRPHRKFARVLHLVIWNMSLLFCFLMLVAAISEIYFRLTVPFAHSTASTFFIPNVGILYRPHSVVRFTNDLDFWTESVSNSLGYLAREPPSSKRAEESCHIAVIGDSFVEARQVPLANRFPVLLESLANRSFPGLDVSTSAFGRSASGQVQQLPFYDHYVRKLYPEHLILSFDLNDFWNNLSFLHNLVGAWSGDPDHPPYSFAQRLKTGEIKLRPPDPDYRAYSMPYQSRPLLMNWHISLSGHSIFVRWLSRKTPIVMQSHLFETWHTSMLTKKVELLRQRPYYASLTKDWKPTLLGKTSRNIFRESIEFTSFALDQFKQRADRDGVKLVILATQRLSSFAKSYWEPIDPGMTPINLLKDMVEAKGIPIIDLGDYVTRRGGKIEELHFEHDEHWNETGHRWVAEAILEYLERNLGGCGADSMVKTPLR